MPTTVPGAFGNVAVIRSVNGNQLIRAPKHTFNIGANYRHDLFGGELTLAANAFFSAKYFAELGNRVSQPHYEIVNASATWRSVARFMWMRTDPRRPPERLCSTSAACRFCSLRMPA